MFEGFRRHHIPPRSSNYDLSKEIEFYSDKIIQYSEKLEQRLINQEYDLKCSKAMPEILSMIVSQGFVGTTVAEEYRLLYEKVSKRLTDKELELIQRDSDIIKYLTQRKDMCSKAQKGVRVDTSLSEREAYTLLCCIYQRVLKMEKQWVEDIRKASREGLRDDFKGENQPELTTDENPTAHELRLLGFDITAYVTKLHTEKEEASTKLSWLQAPYSPPPSHFTFEKESDLGNEDIPRVAFPIPLQRPRHVAIPGNEHREMSAIVLSHRPLTTAQKRKGRKLARQLQQQNAPPKIAKTEYSYASLETSWASLPSFLTNQKPLPPAPRYIHRIAGVPQDNSEVLAIQARLASMDLAMQVAMSEMPTAAKMSPSEEVSIGWDLAIEEAMSAMPSSAKKSSSYEAAVSFERSSTFDNIVSKSPSKASAGSQSRASLPFRPKHVPPKWTCPSVLDLPLPENMFGTLSSTLNKVATSSASKLPTDSQTDGNLPFIPKHVSPKWTCPSVLNLPLPDNMFRPSCSPNDSASVESGLVGKRMKGMNLAYSEWSGRAARFGAQEAYLQPTLTNDEFGEKIVSAEFGASMLSLSRKIKAAMKEDEINNQK